MTDKSPAPSASRDYGFIAIVSWVVFNAAWLILMPVVPAIASATLHRFHLRSKSFPIWAIQQPIPSMYNFANRFQVHETPPDDAQSNVDDTGKRYINHFPARVLTFANRRVRYLGAGDDRWVTIESAYRGQTIKTRFHAKAKAGRGFDMIRLSADHDSTEEPR